MTVAVVVVSTAVALVAVLAGVTRVCTSIHEARDTVEDLLDAVLDRGPDGAWVTPTDDFADWEAELER